MISAIHGASLAQNLAALELDQQRADQASSESDVETQSDVQKFQRREAERALEKAREEAEEAGFWSDVGDVAKVAAAVGGVVAAAGTGGSSLVITLAIVGAAGTAATQTKQGKEFLKDQGMSDEAIMWTGIASAGLSMGAGAGAAAGSGISGLVAAGAMTEGAAGVVGGVAYYGENSAESDKTEHTADARKADRNAEQAGDAIDDEIETLQRNNARHDANMKQINQIQQTRNDTLMFLLQRG